MNPILRLFFSCAYLPFAAGICVHVWQKYEINYIHIMQIEYSNRLNQYLLWKIGSLIMFIFFLFTYVYMNFILNPHAVGTLDSEQEKDRILIIKRGFAIAGCVIITLLWFTPFKILYSKVRKGIFIALFQVIKAPFGNTLFKSYLVAEILTDCMIQLEDVGKIVTYFIMNGWNERLVTNFKSSILMPPPGLKWYLYIVSFLTYWFRM